MKFDCVDCGTAQIRAQSPSFQQIETVWTECQARSHQEQADALIDYPELILGFWQDILQHDVGLSEELRMVLDTARCTLMDAMVGVENHPTFN